MDSRKTPIRYSRDGAVIISYPTLKADPQSLLPAIEKAFGSDPQCLGLIVVDDLPDGYVKKRRDLLLLADTFASLPEDVKNQYVDASSKYRLVLLKTFIGLCHGVF